MEVELEQVKQAAELLRQGRLVAFPTETVYGLGADAANADAVSKIFAAKGRPAGHPLIVHLASAGLLAEWSSTADSRVAELAKAFWPGPLSLVVPKTGLVADEVVGARSTVGLRVPDHPVALAILDSFGGGVAAPSANRFGRISPTLAKHVVHDLGAKVDLVVDGGPCAVGVESTIVEVVGAGPPTLLRPGGVSQQQLETVLGEALLDGSGEAPRASGMLKSHYAPRAKVRLVDLAEAEVASVAEVGVIAPVPVIASSSWVLPSDSAGFAERLYSALRIADAAGVAEIWVVPPLEGEMVAAVVDRLSKAAAPR